MNEFLYIDQFGLVSQDDTIKNIDFTPKHQNYIVSNSLTANCMIFAPEIDWYIKNSSDDNTTKIDTVCSLYELRASCFDTNNSKQLVANLTNEVAVICTKDDFDTISNTNNLVLKHIDISKPFELYGTIGNYQLTQNNTKYICSYIVSVGYNKVYHNNGIYNIPNINMINKTIEKISPTYSYKEYIAYSANTCSYDGRSICHTCGECASVCPSGAISLDTALDNSARLVLDPILCTNCTSCVSVCPSGSLQHYECKNSIFGNIKEYSKQKAILITTEQYIANNDFVIPSDVFPLVLKSLNILNYENILALLQQSGKQIAILDTTYPKALIDTMTTINTIVYTVYNKQGIKLDIDNLEEIEGLMYLIKFADSFEQIDKFAQRLQFMVKASDYGTINTNLKLGKVTVNDSKCTLCMGCASVCKTKAFSTKKDSFTLLFNPSLCIACGYCVSVCSEQCITQDFGKVELNESWFKSSEVAKDDVYCCLECGKPFATTKGILKVASMFSGIFTDPLKNRTLYCCSDCKPKLMLKGMFDAK